MYVCCLHCDPQVYHALNSTVASQHLNLRYVCCLIRQQEAYHALDSTVVSQLLNFRYVHCLPAVESAIRILRGNVCSATFSIVTSAMHWQNKAGVNDRQSAFWLLDVCQIFRCIATSLVLHLLHI